MKCLSIFLIYNNYILLILNILSYAMKKINDQPNIDIRNELNIIKKLDNQFVLKYHDNFNVQGILCIITEYCKVNYIILYL